MVMEFEWDELKRALNVAKHGVDFIFAQALFDGRPVLTAQSQRGGEDRYATVGEIGGRFMTVVWTWRGSTVRIISARRARREEEQRHRAAFGAAD
jgi:hypothetical protein